VAKAIDPNAKRPIDRICTDPPKREFTKN